MCLGCQPGRAFAELAVCACEEEHHDDDGFGSRDAYARAVATRAFVIVGWASLRGGRRAAALFRLRDVWLEWLHLHSVGGLVSVLRPRPGDGLAATQHALRQIGGAVAIAATVFQI